MSGRRSGGAGVAGQRGEAGLPWLGLLSVASLVERGKGGRGRGLARLVEGCARAVLQGQRRRRLVAVIRR